MGAQGSFYPIGVGRPIMFSGMATLILGGAAGVLLMLRYQGIELVALENLPSVGFHWFLMIYGFLFSLISVEVFALLSFEWSGKVAPRSYRLPYLILFWLSVILWIYGEALASLALVAVNMALLAIYASSTFLKPSRLGFRPTHYNLLLTITPFAALAILSLWILQIVLLKKSIYDIGVASLIFPIGSIVAVESRDIPLLTGSYSVSAPRAPRRILVTVSYVLLAAGLILCSITTTPLSSVAGGLLIIAGSILAFKDLGLLPSLRGGARAGLIPGYVVRYSSIHIVTAFTWLVLGGLMFALTPLIGGALALPKDLAVHAITLGFIFNTLFGVDAVLMYTHAGISLREAPKPSYAPYLLLNLSLLLRAIYDVTGAGGVTVASAPLTGAGIVLFFLMHNLRLSRIRRMAAAMRAGSDLRG